MKNQSKAFEKSIKIFDALVATNNNLFRGSLKEKIFFLHLFKCGGTSVAQAIQSCYLNLDIIKHHSIFRLNPKAASNAFQTIFDSSNFPATQTGSNYINRKFREYLVLYYMSQDNTNYIAGHFSFSEIVYQNFSNKYAFITVLRDPVERYISAYFYKRYRNRKLDIEITDYLESEAGQSAGSFYAKNLGCFEQMENFNSETGIKQAKENLHKFKIVGCLEYQQEFLNQFEEKFGRKLNLRVFNQSPKSAKDGKSIINESIRQKIRAICQPDLEIYQYAVDKLVKA
jgi:hypothetical protein